MKIIEPGTLFNMILRCTGKGNGDKGCNALLEVEMDDLRYYPATSEYGHFNHSAAVSFRCPCCGQLTDIPKGDWPREPAKRLKPFSSLWRDTGEDAALIEDDRPR